MEVQQFVDEGLGNAAHLVISEASRTAAVIDPLRDVDVYLAAAQARGVRITLVLDTHVHNDFVAGSRELAARAGARLAAPAGAGLEFPHLPLTEGRSIEAEGLRLRPLATPGHTPEHTSYLAFDGSADTPLAVFTGGSLMAGTVGRSDLLGSEAAQTLVRQQFASVRERLLTLPDDALVYPTHGAGSLCAANAVAERVTTIGAERRRNAVTLSPDAEAFAAVALSGLPPIPAYYARMRPLNQRGPAPLGDLPVLRPLDPATLAAERAAGTILVDTRDAAAFDAGHVPGSLSIGLAPQFGVWLGWVVPEGARLAIIADEPATREAIVRQSVRVGYENFAGFLDGGIAAWERSGRALRAAPRAGREAIGGGVQVVDVRHPEEYAAGHIPGALSLPLGDLPGRTAALLHDQPLLVHCAHEYRSALAISLLERAGYTEVSHLVGGFDGWEADGLPVARAAA